MIHPPVSLLLPLVADDGPFTQFPPGSHLTRWDVVVDICNPSTQELADREFKTSLATVVSCHSSESMLDGV